MAQVTVEIDKSKNEMVIRVPMGAPQPSKSGKTTVLASSHGNVATACLVDGKPVTVGVNAYIPR